MEYVFSMYDADGSRDIDIDEAREMCRDLYGDEGSMYGEGARYSYSSFSYGTLIILNTVQSVS